MCPLPAQGGRDLPQAPDQGTSLPKSAHTDSLMSAGLVCRVVAVCVQVGHDVCVLGSDRSCRGRLPPWSSASAGCGHSASAARAVCTKTSCAQGRGDHLRWVCVVIACCPALVRYACMCSMCMFCSRHKSECPACNDAYLAQSHHLIVSNVSFVRLHRGVAVATALSFTCARRCRRT